MLGFSFIFGRDDLSDELIAASAGDSLFITVMHLHADSFDVAVYYGMNRKGRRTPTLTPRQHDTCNKLWASSTTINTSIMFYCMLQRGR